MPIIGLLSDSHGQASITRRGVDVLLAEGVSLILHLGDIGSFDVIDALATDAAESRIVFGNTDMDQASMARYAQGLGIAVDDPVGRLDWEGQRLVFMHGHNPNAMTQALADQVDYLCHGHTHEKRDQRCGATRVINPGALCRAAQYTVATLDTQRDQLHFHPVARD